MCGRYAVTSAPEALRALFRYEEKPNFPARYNIAPTQPIALVRQARDLDGATARHFLLARWGFLPGFVRDAAAFPLMITARAEGVVDKPSFRNAMRRRRCLIPADAYYEWRRSGAGRRAERQAFLFRRADGTPMALAGLFETYAGADGAEIDTACILTTDANAATGAIHERMPAVIAPADFDRWLDCEAVAPIEAARLLKPAPDDAIAFFEIGPAVNKVANDGPDIQTPRATPLGD